MPIKMHVQRGLEFKKDLYSSRDRTPWLEAVGKELEAKGVSLTVGDAGNALELKSASDLVTFYEDYKKDPDAMAAKIGLPQGREVSEYLSDLVQALDDVVKDTTSVSSGDKIDLTTKSELSKVLGLDDKSVRYASSRSDFGKETRGQAAGVMSVLGVQLQNTAAAKDPLEGVSFIDASTFEGGRPQTGRNSKELETVRRLSGLDPQEIIKLARTEINSSGRTALERMRKPKESEAFSLGYSGIGFDEMRWDSKAHAAREALPFTSLTVESGRIEIDTDDNVREVSQGTDYFADTQYIGKDPKEPSRDLLFEADNEVRARIRYGEPGVPGRLLIQGKIGSAVDENGNKSAAKADIRDDSPTTAEIEAMDEMVKSGTSNWGWNNSQPKAIEAMQLIYESQAEAGKLADIGDHKGVLLLEEGPHIFSQRSRYHLNETSPGDIKNLFEQGDKWIGEVRDLIDQSPNAADLGDVKKQAEALLDRSAILEDVREQLAPMLGKAPADVTQDDVNNLWPREVSWGNNPDKADAKARRVVADAISENYHDFSEAFDDVKSDISGRGREMRFGDEFIDFAKVENTDLALKTTPETFLKYFDEQMAGPDKDAFIEKFGKYLADAGDNDLANAPDKNAAMGSLRADLVREHVDILHRQVEASGTAATQLWFNEARDAYANIDPTTWNFLIDTFDFVQDISPKQWATLTPEQKDGREPIPADKIYNADIVAEVQIELGYEKPYTEAQTKASAAISDAQAGLFMDFALAQASSGVVADDPASFSKFQTELLGGADVDDTVTKLNAFAKDKGSPLTFDAEGLTGLGEELFTQARQGQPTDGHPGLLEDKEMATFMLDTLVGAQNYIADLRGRRVTREAGRAGFDDAKWDDTAMSKGEKAKVELKKLNSGIV